MEPTYLIIALSLTVLMVSGMLRRETKAHKRQRKQLAAMLQSKQKTINQYTEALGLPHSMGGAETLRKVGEHLKSITGDNWQVMPLVGLNASVDYHGDIEVTFKLSGGYAAASPGTYANAIASSGSYTGWGNYTSTGGITLETLGGDTITTSHFMPSTDWDDLVASMKQKMPVKIGSKETTTYTLDELIALDEEE